MKNPQFPFFVRDWLCSRRVLAMSGDAVKAYVYLLAESWLQVPRATLPRCDTDLASMARVTPEKWDAIKGEVLQHLILGKCKEHSGRLYNELLLEISRKQENKQRFNNENAKRSQINAEKPISDNEKENRIEDRINTFQLEVNASTYPQTTKDAFFKYWSEPNKSKTKIRFELQPTWELSRRMATWVSREKVDPKNKSIDDLYQRL